MGNYGAFGGTDGSDAVQSERGDFSCHFSLNLQCGQNV